MSHFYAEIQFLCVNDDSGRAKYMSKIFKFFSEEEFEIFKNENFDDADLIRAFHSKIPRKWYVDSLGECVKTFSEKPEKIDIDFSFPAPIIRRESINK